MKIKQEFEIVLEDETQFPQVWDALLALGYYVEQLPTSSSRYLLAKSDGRIGFENETAHYKNVTLIELLTMAKQHKDEQLKLENELYEQERPLFEAFFKRLGGRLVYLIWDGSERVYAVDKSSNFESESDYPGFNEEIQAHAEHVTGCLHAWIKTGSRWLGVRT